MRWRAGYQPAMQRVRAGALPWTSLDALHRMILDELLPEFGLRLNERDRRELNLAWHRLAPWPDVLRGLARLRRDHLIGTLSNGNVRCWWTWRSMRTCPGTACSPRSCSATTSPIRRSILGPRRCWNLPPRQVMLVAAHKDDLTAARRCGLSTAFVRRPLERGRRVMADIADDPRCTFNADDFIDLARQLG